MKRSVIEWSINPFRGDDFARLWGPYAERAHSYGAKNASLVRCEDDPLHFIQTADWEDESDFETYWEGSELSTARADILGMFTVPVVSKWYEIVAPHGE